MKRSMAPDRSMGTREQAVFVAQQLHFANTLAGNDPTHRARAMKKLRKYLFARANGKLSFTHDDFMRIWKGLFYCMWMSDKPLIQEELAEEISQLVHCFQRADMALTFIQAFFDTLIVEWFGIDYHRLDKFQMFVRRFLRQSLTYCKNKNWKKVSVTGLCDVFESTVLSPSKCVNDCDDISLIMHFSEIFVEELAKVGSGQLSKKIILCFLKPFMSNLAGQSDFRLQHVIRDRVFYCLIKQSPEGLEYEEKFEAWKRAGFPGTSWKEMVFVGKEDKRSGVKLKNLDPRAGKVNVYLPHLPFDAGSVANTLSEFAEKSSDQQCRKFIKKISHKFQELAEGRYPLALNLSKTLLDSHKYRFSKQKIDDAVEDLLKFNEKLKKEEKQMKKNGKRKKNSSNLKKSKKIKLENDYADEEDDSENHKKIKKVDEDDAEKNYERLESANEGDESSENFKNEEGKLSNSENHGENTNHQSSSANETEVLDPSVLHSGTVTVNAIITSDTDELGEANYEMNKEDTNGSRADNSFSTNIAKKGKRKHSVSSWDISEILSLQDEPSGIQETGEESKKKIVLKEELNDNVETKMEISLQNELQKSDLVHEVQEVNELNENRVPDEDVLQNSPVVKCQDSIVDEEADDSQGEEHDLIIPCEEVETLELAKEAVTPLRRSTRKSNKNFPSLEENVKEEEIDTPIQVTSTPLRSSARIRLNKLEDQDRNSEMTSDTEDKENITDASSSDSVIDNANRTPLLRTPAKRRLRKVSTPKRKSLTPFSIIRGKGRISTVPDREIPSINETGELSESIQNIMPNVPDNSTPSPINETFNGVLRDEDILSKRRSLSMQNILQTPAKKRVSLQSTPASTKKVNIVLQMNKSQAVSEYVAAVKQSPSVPHDANKMPCKGVLKRTSIKSPINPFYVPPKGLK